MQKFFHPSATNIYLWALVSFFCLVLMVTPNVIQLNDTIEYRFLIGFTFISGYSLFKSLCGILFNKLYIEGGVLSVALLESCFFALFLLMALNN